MSADARQPRVTILTTYYHPIIGGVESHARQIAADLHARGLAVRVVTRRLDRSVPQPAAIDGVRIDRIGPHGGRTRFAKWTLVPFALAALLAERPRPDVIFCPDFRGVGLAALAAGRLRGCPVVLQAETPGALSCGAWDTDLARVGLQPGGRLAGLLKRPLRSAYGAATLYNCISREIEREAIACGIPPSRLVRIPHGVDVHRFQPASAEERRAERARHGWPADGLLCLYLGRVSVEKGILDLLSAWDRLARPDATLVVVGPDDPGHPLDAGTAARSFVAERGLKRRVLFAGPAADPAPLLRAADLFVQPSHYEAFGIAAIEAMACGLPIVATRTGGLTDFLIEEDTALLVDPREPDQLATALRRLIDDQPLRERLGRRARESAARTYDKDVVADAYARLFGDLARSAA